MPHNPGHRPQRAPSPSPKPKSKKKISPGSWSGLGKTIRKIYSHPLAGPGQAGFWAGKKLAERFGPKPKAEAKTIKKRPVPSVRAGGPLGRTPRAGGLTESEKKATDRLGLVGPGKTPRVMPGKATRRDSRAPTGPPPTYPGLPSPSDTKGQAWLKAKQNEIDQIKRRKRSRVAKPSPQKKGR